MNTPTVNQLFSHYHNYELQRREWTGDVRRPPGTQGQHAAALMRERLRWQGYSRLDQFLDFLQRFAASK